MGEALTTQHAQEQAEINSILRDATQLGTRLRFAARRSREISQAITKLDEATLWLGMDLVNAGQKGAAL